MRAITSIAAILLLLSGPAVLAAPTCQNANGDTVHCGVPGAMPQGWTLPPEVFAERQAAKAPEPGAGTVMAAIGGIILFLAMIALLPEFDGSRGADWDKEEDDPPR